MSIVPPNTPFAPQWQGPMQSNMTKQPRNLGNALALLTAASVVAFAAARCTGPKNDTRVPDYNAMFSNFAEIGADWNPTYPAEIVKVSFHLPVDAYVYISTSGEVTFSSGSTSCSGLATLWIRVDEKTGRADWDTYRFHEGGFSVSSFYRLKKGDHTAYLLGRPYATSYKLAYMSANIVVIATQQGSIGRNSWFIQPWGGLGSERP